MQVYEVLSGLLSNTSMCVLILLCIPPPSYLCVLVMLPLGNRFLWISVLVKEDQ
jgi:hypothetical protein